VTFPFNRAQISDDAKAMIDEAIAQLKAENRGVFFEIEGHTDSSGPEAYNLQLGHDRALAVRNYLHDQHGIALNRIEVISYGETKPVTDNQNRTNRAQNRRVVIKVLE
jgi:outer membrane protein OmpA-like peptidoglycan-associated protein